jgi:glycosyltransferase involved in cell wall biosynthesis
MLRQIYRNWELILVTQGSDVSEGVDRGQRSDPALIAAVKRAVARDGRIRHIHVERFGKCRALNAAIEVTGGEAVAFTDDDCEPDPDWLEVIAGCFAKEPRVGMVGGDLIPTKPPLFRVSTCPTAFTMEYIYRPSELGFSAPHGFYGTGGDWAVRRSTIELVGRFDECLGPGTPFPTGEDTDYGLRCEALDVWMQTSPRVRVQHTFGRRFGIREVMKLHRGYALGQGALCGKLKLWGHRLAEVWDGTVTVSDRVRALGNPSHFLRDAYKERYWRQGRDQFLEWYELGEDLLSRPKASRARQTGSVGGR